MKDKSEWVKDMENAMAALTAACVKNEDWTACHSQCPFTDICDLCFELGIGAPETWNESKKNSQESHAS